MGQVSAHKGLFGDKVEIAINDTDKRIAQDVIEDAYYEGLRLQKIFNFYDASSELSKLNQKRELVVSHEIIEVLTNALELCEITNGHYDIAIGKKIAAKKNVGNEIDVGCSYKDIRIDGCKVILLSKDVQIDLGSVAKGYIADKMIECMMSLGVISGIVDARGDLRAFGDCQEVIDIQHPRDKSRVMASIRIQDQAVATSGDYKQFYGSYENCHIINQKDYISITVVASNLAKADLFATALFVSSEDDVKKIASKNKDVKVMTIDKSLNIKMYNGFEDLIVET